MHHKARRIKEWCRAKTDRSGSPAGCARGTTSWWRRHSEKLTRKSQSNLRAFRHSRKQKAGPLCRCSRQRVGFAGSMIEAFAHDLGEAGWRVGLLEEFDVAQLGVFAHDIGAVAAGVNNFEIGLARL